MELSVGLTTGQSGVKCLSVIPKVQNRIIKPPCRLKISTLNETPIQEELKKRIGEADIPDDFEGLDIETARKQFRDVTYSASADVLGFVKHKHQDWFDEK